MERDRDHDLTMSPVALFSVLKIQAIPAMGSGGVNLVWKQDLDVYRLWEIEQVVVRKSEKRSLGSVCRTEVLMIFLRADISFPAPWRSL